MRALLVLLCVIVSVQSAFGKDTGEFAEEPGASDWFKRPAQLVCCSESDGHRGLIRKVGPLYEAYIEGAWYPVPLTGVIKDPSPFADPVIWYYRDATGKPIIRCIALSWGL